MSAIQNPTTPASAPAAPKEDLFLGLSRTPAMKGQFRTSGDEGVLEQLGIEYCSKKNPVTYVIQAEGVNGGKPFTVVKMDTHAVHIGHQGKATQALWADLKKAQDDSETGEAVFRILEYRKGAKAPSMGGNVSRI